jgi:membrane associated rhomboid family serine protease
MLNQLPPITRTLLIANGVVFLLQLAMGPASFSAFMLWPLGDYAAGVAADGTRLSVGFLPWQVVTYGFLHGGWAHLLFNMLALFMFGSRLEYTWGDRRYLIYYFTCIIGAGLVQLLVATYGVSQGRLYPTIGASGGVFGLLLAYGMLFPRERVMLLFPPIPMQARTLVIIFGALTLLMGVTGTAAGIAHFAHLGGMLFGFGLIQYWRGRWPFSGRRGGGGQWPPRR